LSGGDISNARSGPIHWSATSTRYVFGAIEPLESMFAFMASWIAPAMTEPILLMASQMAM
jgi:hypothetical protein